MQTQVSRPFQPLEVSEYRSLPSEEYPVKTMPRVLNNIDLLAIYVMIILFITNATTAASGGAAAFTYFILAGLVYFIPSAIATAQLTSMYPHEGSLYNWTHRAIGGFWSFFSGFCAWFPGILVMISSSAIIVSFINGLNNNWLTQPWQQGLVIIAVIFFSGVLATQRLRMVQHLVNVVVVIYIVGIVIIGAAGVVWLAGGHPSATNFTALTDWSISWHPSGGNIALFGLITLAYLGVEGPVTMAAEISNLRTVRKHLIWGTALVFIGYFIVTFSLLVVAGPADASASPFSLVKVVDTALGSGAGAFVALCLMSFFLVSTSVYSFTYARLPMVAAIDQRLPAFLGKLNKHRVPANTIWLQTIFAATVTFLIYFAVPFVPTQVAPGDLSTIVYNVIIAAAALVWTFSTLFLFLDVVILYFRERALFMRQQIFPLPLLAITMPIGAIACVLAIFDTLLFSWIGKLMDNTQWLLSIGSLTVVCIIIAIIGSLYATSEAAWEGIRD